MARTYLALGDSYTIGEGVELRFTFPYQLIQLLRTRKLDYAAPEIIAKTGWTTDELSTAIDEAKLLERYDLVSLLIGVNNQYRGRSLAEFKVEFGHLLQRSIQLAGNAKSVYVLSIPDWGQTPFAVSRDREQIRREIDSFNDTCKEGALLFGSNYIDITTSNRAHSSDNMFLAPDGLHPSGPEYANWAQRVAEIIK